MSTRTFLNTSRSVAIAAGVLLATWLAGTGCRKTEPIPPGGPDAVLESAWEALDLADWQRAEAYFGHLVDSPDANGTVKSEAAYGMGYVSQFRKPGDDVDAAMEYYKRCVEEFPATRVTPLAMMALGRQADLPKDVEDRQVAQARQWYRRIIDEFPEHFTSHEATLWLALTYMEDRDERALVDQGIEMMRTDLQRDPNHFCAATMHQLIANVHTHRAINAKDKETRVAEFAKAVDEFDAAEKAGLQLTNERGSMCDRAGRICEHVLKDYPRAIEWYEKVVHDIKRHQRFYVAKLALIRLHTKLGDRSAETGNHTEALRRYRIALDYGPEEVERPTALLKAAAMAEKTRDQKLAHRWYKEILEQYPDSAEAADARAGMQRTAPDGEGE
jgi:tetratricopeptide (TPR) repeat protein